MPWRYDLLRAVRPTSLCLLLSQIMDPKMDSGFLKEGESLEDNFDVLSMLSPSETVGIMDQMICHEVGTPERHLITIGHL